MLYLKVVTKYVKTLLWVESIGQLYVYNDYLWVAENTNFTKAQVIQVRKTSCNFIT